MGQQNQHYVPRFLLRRFASNNEHIFVYDKSNDRQFRTNIANIASEKSFYDYDVDEEQFSIEPDLSDFESKSAPILNAILEYQSLQSLTDNDRLVLSHFIVLQHVRTRRSRIAVHNWFEGIAEQLRDKGCSKKQIKDMGFTTDIGELKAISVEMILNVATSLAPFIFQRNWRLRRTSLDSPFYTSDNPVALVYSHYSKSIGDLGIFTPGLEIYFPISSTLCLHIVCPSIDREIRESSSQLMTRECETPGFINDLLRTTPDALKFDSGYVENQTIDVESNEIDRVNLLQVGHTDRFVFCQTNSFDLVTTILSNNEELRAGVRFTAH